MGRHPAGASAPSNRRTVAIAIGAIAAVILLAFALLLSNAYGAERIAENARAQHWTNAAAGTASLVRAANGQAVFFAVDLELGVASESAVEQAAAEARANLADLRTIRAATEAVAVVPAERAFRALDDFANTAGDVLDAIEAGDAALALELNSTAAERTYEELRIHFVDLQASITDRIESNEDVAGLIGSITRFLVTLIIPAAALIIYRSLVKRQALARELELAARLEAEQELRKSKDEFIASISHEIRTPLTSIYGFSELLVESGVIDPAATADLVGMIHSESMELSRMVEDLLTAARVDAEALDYAVESMDLRDEVDVAATPFMRRGTDIDVQVAAGLEVMADRMRLRQVMRNLISNAIRHGGPAIRIEASLRGGNVRCSVIDDGPGVSEDVESRLFEKFVHKGSAPLLVGSVGLGLAVAHSVVAGMGGELTYERVDDETHFVLRLPVPIPQSRDHWSGDPFAANAPPVLGIAASQPLDSSHEGPYGLTGGPTRPDL